VQRWGRRAIRRNSSRIPPAQRRHMRHTRIERARHRHWRSRNDQQVPRSTHLVAGGAANGAWIALPLSCCRGTSTPLSPCAPMSPTQVQQCRFPTCIAGSARAALTPSVHETARQFSVRRSGSLRGGWQHPPSWVTACRVIPPRQAPCWRSVWGCGRSAMGSAAEHH